MEAAPADSGQLLYAPVSGRIRALTRIKDPVFSSEVLGKGCAIEPSCGEVVAPADGIVKKIAKTHHAISLLCDNGMEVLIHVGMDTVELKGKGYELFVQTGDHVQKGQLLSRASNGEARRLVVQGGVLADGEKVAAPTVSFTAEQLAKGIVIKKGKKIYHKVTL